MKSARSWWAVALICLGLTGCQWEHQRQYLISSGAVLYNGQQATFEFKWLYQVYCESNATCMYEAMDTFFGWSDLVDGNFLSALAQVPQNGCLTAFPSSNQFGIAYSSHPLCQPLETTAQ